MSHSIYSEEELKQLFQNLFQEKKKVKELEQKVQHLHDHHHQLQQENSELKNTTLKKVDSEEVEKLKSMVAMYKKKSAQAVHALYENEHQKVKQETSLAQQLAQSQNRIQELSEENSALLDQQNQLKICHDQIESKLESLQKNVHEDQAEAIKSAELMNLYQDVVSQNKRQKEQIEKLSYSLKDQEKKIRDLHKFEFSYKEASEKNDLLKSQLEKASKDNQLLHSESQSLSKSLQENQSHSEQLERALKLLRNRSQEAQLELSQLRDEYLRSQEALSNLTEQLHVTQGRLHEHTQELQRVYAEKQAAVEELESLQGQFSILKSKIVAGQEDLKAVQKEKINVEIISSEKASLLSQLEIEVAAIKQSLSTGILEVKNIETKHLELVNEKAALYNRAGQLQQALESQKEETSSLQQQLAESVNREENLRLQNEKLQINAQNDFQDSLKEQKIKIHEQELALQKHYELLRQKEQQAEEYNNQISRLTQEKYKLEDSLSNMTRNQDEQEARIKVAQQHLGKKVKEVALLHEKIEDQKNLVSESQSSLNQLRSKINEMQSFFDLQIQQEKKLQEQLHETVRFSESQIVKWEEKYLKTYDKLKVYEEKQQQMHALFASIGNVIGSQQIASPISNHYSPPMANPVINPPIQNKSTVQLVDTSTLLSQSFVEDTIETSSLPEHPSLFDLEPSRHKIRQTLFD